MKKITVFLLIILHVTTLYLPIKADELSIDYATRLGAIYTLLNDINFDDITDFSILSSFKDCEDLDEYAKVRLSFAVDKGILNGYKDKTIRPYAHLTRAEFACLLYRCREFYLEKPKYVDFLALYNDLDDWNKVEIAYCMEKGFLMGYGNSFGSGDYITHEQLEIVSERFKYGLTAKEKYTLLSVNNSSPINMTKVLENRSNTELLLMPELNINEELNLNIDKNERCSFLEKTMDIRNNIDYKNYLTEEGYEFFISRYWNLTKIIPGYIDSNTKEYVNNRYNFLEHLIINKVVRESFCIISPNNIYQKYSAFGYVNNTARGYEYFIYHESMPEGLPEGVELGKWYKRVVTLEYIDYSSRQETPDLKIQYEKAELVPFELLS